MPLPQDKSARKEMPITRGVLDYFPNAIAEVARVSFIGNQQHNPGEPMHWARGKSADHADCIARHLIERGTIDDDGLRHSAKAAWRSLALLQEELEAAAAQEIPAYESGNFDPPSESVRDDETQKAVIFDSPARESMYRTLLGLNCPTHVAYQIASGTTFSGPQEPDFGPFVYVAGPMRGIPHFNFPAFDRVRDELLRLGFNVISPADIDHHAGDMNEAKAEITCTQADFAFRDFWALYYLNKQGNKNNGIVLLRNWERSTGANAEIGLARWMGLSIKEFDRDFAPRETTYRLANGCSLLYRVRNGVVEVIDDLVDPDDVWEPSCSYGTVSEFNQDIKDGVLLPVENQTSCASSSSATSTNRSATPATCASARTCTVDQSAMPLSS